MKGKKIIVGVTGGIAAYKAAELVRQLVREGVTVRVAMTRNATRFITPLTLEALSGSRVVSDMWDSRTEPMDHIDWGQNADLVILAPATANFVANMAHGKGDDFLSTMILAATAKILLCPAMNTHMFSNPAVQDNLRILRERGHCVMEPAEGELACGAEGAGRLPETDDILERARALLTKQDLAGLRVLVTAGATMEAIDPVRFITNRSSGKMGFALARVAGRRGAEVTLVTGPTKLTPPTNVRVERVQTAEEMRRAVFEHSGNCDVILKAAAVLDYRPKKRAEQKIKKEEGPRSLELVRTPDILAELGSLKESSRYLLVGFAAETEDLIENSTEKLRKKNLDMIVANDVSREDAGFESDTNLVKVIYRDGRVEELPLMTKQAVADQILDRVKKLQDTRARESIFHASEGGGRG